MSHAGIYPTHVPYRAMNLVCFQSQGRLKFATPEEHVATPRAGKPKWEGVVAVTADGTLSCTYRPGLDERYMDTPAFSGVRERVLAEGVRYNS